MTSACLIIDDPRLCPRYGCLNYSDLLNEMKKRDFFTEIAFIPLNYWFSDRRTTKLFAKNTDRLGICIHGLDHVGNEFGGCDYNKLKKMADTALWRMEQLKKRTGLNYDRVMVFPQGRFSSVAMKALKDAGYTAAFNSETDATDDSVPLQELMKPYTEHFDLPFFLRRYPSDRKAILEDFKNGRPIILVEHHTAFKNDHLFETIDWVNSLGNIEWKSLAQICLENKLHEPSCSPCNNFKSSLKSVARRVACEIRDHYFHTNPVLNKLYNKIN